ncbi:MAG: zinc finger domain-containing protein [Thermoplasmatota archaeon]
MSENRNRCTSCGIPLSGSKDVRFNCPNCGNTTIGRCAGCRDQAANYTCPECGFTGP